VLERCPSGLVSRCVLMKDGQLSCGGATTGRLTDPRRFVGAPEPARQWALADAVIDDFLARTWAGVIPLTVFSNAGGRQVPNTILSG